MFDFIFNNTQDFLNIALGVSALSVSLFLSFVLIRLFKTLGLLNDLLLDVQDTLEIIQNYLWQPARFFFAIKEKISGIFGNLFSFFHKKK
jgi:hypothetical protein